MGEAFFIYLNSSLPRRLAQCLFQQFPVRNTQDFRCFFHPTHFIGGLIDAYSLFISHDLCPAFQQEVRQMPHMRLWCLLNTMPLPSRDLAYASWHQH